MNIQEIVEYGPENVIQNPKSYLAGAGIEFRHDEHLRNLCGRVVNLAARVLFLKKRGVAVPSDPEELRRKVALIRAEDRRAAAMQEIKKFDSGGYTVYAGENTERVANGTLPACVEKILNLPWSILPRHNGKGGWALLATCENEIFVIASGWFDSSTVHQGSGLEGILHVGSEQSLHNRGIA